MNTTKGRMKGTHYMAEGPKNKTEQEIVDRFKAEICERSALIDPREELDWFALSLGFYIACNLSFDDAHRLSLWTRYEKEYWQA